MYSGCLIKAFARHQASVTLSSCEAELAAIQGAVQEANRNPEDLAVRCEEGFDD